MFDYKALIIDTLDESYKRAVEEVTDVLNSKYQGQTVRIKVKYEDPHKARPQYKDIFVTVETIMITASKNIIIVTDAGKRHSPMPQYGITIVNEEVSNED